MTFIKFNSEFRQKLVDRMDAYVHFVYKVSRKFPKEELYGSVSQFRRAAMSIILNYVEGYARRKRAIQLNMLETSYGSLQESKYVLKFSLDERWITNIDYDYGKKLAEEIGAMLWTELSNLEKKLNAK